MQFEQKEEESQNLVQMLVNETLVQIVNASEIL